MRERLRSPPPRPTSGSTRMAKNLKPRAAPAGEMHPTAGDVLLASLRQRGVAHFFANPGTDFPAIVEGFARARESGTQVPRPVLVPHENLAVAMAHGAYLVTGEPQAVMVHVNVGTANTINMLADAARDRVPLLLMAGRTPIMEAGAFGARSRPIHWAQEMFDQAGMVRELVKWDYELRNPEQAHLVVARALEAATASPSGPVYLMPAARGAVRAGRDACRQAEPRAAPGRRPSRSGRHRAAGRLADRRRAPAADRRERRPRAGRGRSAGPRCASASPCRWSRTCRTTCACPPTIPAPRLRARARYLDDTDLVVVLECDVPWMPGVKAPSPSARVVHVGEDPAFLRYPMRNYRSDLSITANVAAVLAGPGGGARGSRRPQQQGKAGCAPGVGSGACQGAAREARSRWQIAPRPRT